MNFTSFRKSYASYSIKGESKVHTTVPNTYTAHAHTIDTEQKREQHSSPDGIQTYYSSTTIFHLKTCAFYEPFVRSQHKEGSRVLCTPHCSAEGSFYVCSSQQDSSKDYPSKTIPKTNTTHYMIGSIVSLMIGSLCYGGVTQGWDGKESIDCTENTLIPTLCHSRSMPDQLSINKLNIFILLLCVWIN